VVDRIGEYHDGNSSVLSPVIPAGNKRRSSINTNPPDGDVDNSGNGNGSRNEVRMTRLPYQFFHDSLALA